MRALRLVVILLAVCAASGCYVASVAGLADATSTVFDDAIVGSWRNDDDDLQLILARDEWRTYDVTLVDRTGEQRFTGRLTDLAGGRFFDLTVHAGTEPGLALIPVHVIGRLSLRSETLLVELLDYDWFRGRLRRGSLTVPVVLDERETVLMTASRAQLRRWLTANAALPAMFSDAMTFTRDSHVSR